MTKTMDNTPALDDPTWHNDAAKHTGRGTRWPPKRTARKRPTSPATVAKFAALADNGWQDFAICKGLDPSLFFPERGDNQGLEYARSICAACPVQGPCAEYAISTTQPFGVWGGTTERQRRAARVARKAS